VSGYPSIIKARSICCKHLKIREELAGQDDIASNTSSLKVIGTIQPRPDAASKVTGSALFTDDLHFPGMLHARVKRAGVPHAILKKVDIQKALALPGVVVILTAHDIPGENSHGLVRYDWPVMVATGERIRYVGDAIAVIAAESRMVAAQAMEMIEVEYEILPPTNDAIQAYSKGAPSLHEGGNLLKHIQIRKGDLKKGLSEADLIVEHTFRTAITEHAFMEPECSVARQTDDGRIEIYVGSQIPYADREQVARVLGWKAERIHIIGQLIGGGFGGKEDIAGQIHAALLAHTTHRPVKLLFDRHESMLVHPKRHATQIRVRIGAKQDGHLTAVETELYGDTGAYASLGEKVMTRATAHSAGPYVVPHVSADCYAMYTNNPPAGAFRGFGVSQSAFAIESMMDIVAESLGIDPVKLRQINALTVGNRTNTGQILRESVGLLECIDKVDAEVNDYLENPFSSKLIKLIRI
jgi:xanthine dehydrogenase molybdenum-binding subunit